jgi:uncharacterized damage-inducible protein DinB
VTVPSIDGHNAPAVVADEIETALAYLGYLRDAVLRKLDGLSEDEARRAVVPSGTSLLGLTKHLARVEGYWIQRRFAGLDWALGDLGFTLTAEDDIGTVRRSYVEETRRTDEIVRACGDPERPMARGTHGLTLRWALAHLSEETARHAGHADILRELLDGSTGR